MTRVASAGADETGQVRISLREAFGQALVELGRKREDFVVLDADVAGGTGTASFKSAFPHRFIDFGIAEANMMAAAAGLATTGLIPVVTTFSVFAMLRALEQLRTFVAYPRFNVKVVGSHCGVDAGPDGATAQAVEDLAIARALPNLTVVAPADAVECAAALEAIVEHSGPVYMRSGRSPAPVVFSAGHRFVLGRGQVLLDEGTDVTIIACGVMTARACEAASRLRHEGIGARVVNMPTIKPLDDELVVASARATGAVVTCEDHSVIGGLGGAVAECLGREFPVPLAMVGVADRFGESGEPGDLARRFGLTAADIAEAARKLIARAANSRAGRSRRGRVVASQSSSPAP